MVVNMHRNIHYSSRPLVMTLYTLCFSIRISKMDLSPCYPNNHEMVLNRHSLWILESLLRDRLCIRRSNRNFPLLYLPHCNHLDLQSIHLLFPSILIKTIHLVGAWSNWGSVPHNGCRHCHERTKRRNF